MELKSCISFIFTYLFRTNNYLGLERFVELVSIMVSDTEYDQIIKYNLGFLYEETPQDYQLLEQHINSLLNED